MPELFMKNFTGLPEFIFAEKNKELLQLNYN